MQHSLGKKERKKPSFNTRTNSAPNKACVGMRISTKAKTACTDDIAERVHILAIGVGRVTIEGHIARQELMHQDNDMVVAREKLRTIPTQGNVNIGHNRCLVIHNL